MTSKKPRIEIEESSEISGPKESAQKAVQNFVSSDSSSNAEIVFDVIPVRRCYVPRCARPAEFELLVYGQKVGICRDHFKEQTKGKKLRPVRPDSVEMTGALKAVGISLEKSTGTYRFSETVGEVLDKSADAVSVSEQRRLAILEKQKAEMLNRVREEVAMLWVMGDSISFVDNHGKNLMYIDSGTYLGRVVYTEDGQPLYRIDEYGNELNFETALIADPKKAKKLSDVAMLERQKRQSAIIASRPIEEGDICIPKDASLGMGIVMEVSMDSNMNLNCKVKFMGNHITTVRVGNPYFEFRKRG